MRKENWYDDIDIDRRDSNGNYYDEEDYSPCQCRSEPYYPPIVPLTNEQVYKAELSLHAYTLSVYQDEIKRFVKYKTEAEREVKLWCDRIENKEKQINETIDWIKNLKQRFGIEE